MRSNNRYENQADPSPADQLEQDPWEAGLILQDPPAITLERLRHLEPYMEAMDKIADMQLQESIAFEVWIPVRNGIIALAEAAAKIE